MSDNHIHISKQSRNELDAAECDFNVCLRYANNAPIENGQTGLIYRLTFFLAKCLPESLLAHVPSCLHKCL